MALKIGATPVVNDEDLGSGETRAFDAGDGDTVA
ncbi:hypothetical protein SAMN05444004_102331 [Jannaschia faecimaris]|uniref:Uncharacterized protein n=1 Tax=Jannaschia faecimaris TaxID=1244108 RepID=A0A1H3LVT8_9RHOB|nr:hypothetical protein SAMN05444004_102331 [Jannaschia faecimaris]